MPYNPQQFKALFETELGQALWAFLNERDNVVRLETASELRRPALQVLGQRVLDAFGESARADQVKRMMGHMTRQILEARGFQLVKAGHPLRNNPLFSSSALYAALEPMT